MIDGLHMSANVYDGDGVLAASFVGDYETLRNIFALSVDDKHCPSYYQKRIHEGFVKITDYQLIVAEHIVNPAAWMDGFLYTSTDLVIPFDVFICGDLDADEPLGALLEYAFAYRRLSEGDEEDKNG